MSAGRGLRVALVTCARLGRLTADDELLRVALEAAGAAVGVEVWNDPSSTDWTRYHSIVLRSTWDYHLRAEEFRRWISLPAVAPRLVNRAALVSWNMDKRYLMDLAESGVTTVPTRLLGPDCTADQVLETAQAAGWADVVLKPAISADGWMTERFDPCDRTAVAGWLRSVPGRIIVQPFRSEVMAEGEWSLVFVSGDYSHAVRKRAAPNEFRVQETFGGAVERAEMDQAAVAAATDCLAVLPQVPTYARVDVLRQADGCEVMELELIEPSLFLSHSSDAAGRMARAIVELPVRRDLA